MQPKRPRAAASRAPQPPSPRTRTPHFQSPTDSSVRPDFPPRAPRTAALCAGNASRLIRKSRRKHPAGGERPSEHPRHGAGVARAAEPARHAPPAAPPALRQQQQPLATSAGAAAPFRRRATARRRRCRGEARASQGRHAALCGSRHRAPCAVQTHTAFSSLTSAF